MEQFHFVVNYTKLLHLNTESLATCARCKEEFKTYLEMISSSSLIRLVFQYERKTTNTIQLFIVFYLIKCLFQLIKRSPKKMCTFGGAISAVASIAFE